MLFFACKITYFEDIYFTSLKVLRKQNNFSPCAKIKLKLFDLLRSTINLPVTQIFYFLPYVLTQMRLEKTQKKIILKFTYLICCRRLI